MSNRIFFFLNAALSFSAVAFLFWLLYLRKGTGDPSTLSFLPAVNASLNAATALLLIRGWFAIRSGDRALHAFCQKSAFVVSAVFLVCYITYHSVHGDSHFPGTGFIRPVYFSILISHICLSVVVLPMVLTTFFFALSARFATHRKWARATLPIWLYVSITGVLVFLFLKIYPPA
jgi:putative membrane protein